MTIFVGWVTSYPPTMPDEIIDLMVGNIYPPYGGSNEFFEGLK